MILQQALFCVNENLGPSYGPGFRPASLAGTLRWGDFLLPESHQRPPKAGPSPALWNPPRWCWVKLRPFVSALGLAGSHRWLGCSMGSTCSYGNPFFYFQGLTLVKQLFPAADGLAPGGGNAASPGRPGHGNRPAIGPVAQGGLVWWHKQEPQLLRNAQKKGPAEAEPF